MKHYLLESLAPLVCRSGRPFGTQADADDINFPLPSAAAGLMRSQHLEAQGWILDAETENSTRGRLRDDQHHALQQLASKGPFLAQEDRDGNITVLVPNRQTPSTCKNAPPTKPTFTACVPPRGPTMPTAVTCRPASCPSSYKTPSKANPNPAPPTGRLSIACAGNVANP